MQTALIILLALEALVILILVLILRYQAYASRSDRNATDNALRQLQRWRDADLAAVRQEQLTLARTETLIQFEQWKAEAEQLIRRDAIRKSAGVTLGKVTEHFIPYLPGFAFDPRDARFLGSPIDFIVFDGLSEGDVRSIVFVEVKTGKGALTTRERRVRDAVERANVRWIELRPDFEGTNLELTPASASD